MPACGNCTRAEKVCSGYPLSSQEEQRTEFPTAFSIPVPLLRKDTNPPLILPASVSNRPGAAELAPGIPKPYRDQVSPVVDPPGRESATPDVSESHPVAAWTSKTLPPPFPGGPHDSDTEVETNPMPCSDSGLSDAPSTSAAPSDAGSIEALMLMLIDHGDLQCLWPQLVRTLGDSQFNHFVQWLIKNYSGNLVYEAKSPLEIQASVFVMTHAESIARRIHSSIVDWPNDFPAVSKHSARLVSGAAGEEELLPKADPEYVGADIRLVEAFLLKSAAFPALQARLESLVRASSGLRQDRSSLSGLGRSLRLGWQLATARFGFGKLRAPQPGATRLRFTCVSRGSLRVSASCLGC